MRSLPLDSLLAVVREAHGASGGSDQDILLIDAEVPRPFTGDDLLRSVQANAELMKTTDYVETMLMRIRTLRAITNCIITMQYILVA
jgi:hypothetical protein